MADFCDTPVVGARGTCFSSAANTELAPTIANDAQIHRALMYRLDILRPPYFPGERSRDPNGFNFKTATIQLLRPKYRAAKRSPAADGHRRFRRAPRFLAE